MFRRLVVVLLSLLFSVPYHVHAGFEEGLTASRVGDNDLAFVEFRAAAEAGDARAFGKLASMYLYGLGTETEFVRAYAWFDLATAAGDKYAARFRDAVVNELTAPQREEAERLAEELISRFIAAPAEASSR